MSDSEKFVERFTRVWSSPQPEEFADLWTQDGTLLHPGMSEPIGRLEIVDYLRRITALTPDIRLRPLRWASVDKYVFIEWTISATFAGEQLSWNGVDRFTLRGDRASDGSPSSTPCRCGLAWTQRCSAAQRWRKRRLAAPPPADGGRRGSPRPTERHGLVGLADRLAAGADRRRRPPPQYGLRRLRPDGDRPGERAVVTSGTSASRVYMPPSPFCGIP